MSKVIQDTYPVYPRGAGTTNVEYPFSYTYYDDSEITVWVMPGTDRSHKVILPTTGYYTITRTGSGATPGGVVKILNMANTDTYMRAQLAIDWPSNDWSAATFQNIALQRTIAYSQPVTQPIGYSGSVTEEGDDHAVLEIQQLNDRTTALENLLIWSFDDCTLTKYMIPVCDETGNYKFIDSHWKDDGTELSAYLPTKIYSSLWVQTTLDVVGHATLGSLEVEGTSLFHGAVNMEQTLDVAGAITGQSTLDIAGATHLGSTLDVVGNTTLQAELHVIGDASLDNNLTVLGHTQVNTFTATGAALCETTLQVNGNITGNSNFSLTGNATIGGTLDVTGVASFHDNVVGDQQITAPTIIATDRLQTNTFLQLGTVNFKPLLAGMSAGDIFIATPSAGSEDLQLKYTTIVGEVMPDGTADYLTKVSADNRTLVNSPVRHDATNSAIVIEGNKLQYNGITWIADTAGTTKVKLSPAGAAVGDSLVFKAPSTPGQGYDWELAPYKVEGSGGSGSGLPDPALGYVGDIMEIVDNAGANEWAVTAPVIPRPTTQEPGLVPTIGADGITIEWAFNSASSGVTVSASTIAMGGAYGTVIDSKMIQSDTEQTTFNEYAYGTAQGVALYNPITINDPVAQKLACSPSAKNGITNILFNIDKYALPIGITAPLSIKRLDDDTVEIFIETGSVPHLLLRQPSYDNGLVYWEGHDDLLTDQYLIPHPTATLTESKISNWTFIGAARTGAVYSRVIQINGGPAVVLDYTIGNTYQITYANSIVLFSFSPSLPNGKSLMLFFYKVNDIATITWPAGWKWNNGVAPDSNYFIIGRAAIILIEMIDGAIEATILYKNSEVAVINDYPTILGPKRDHAVVSFYDSSGDNIRCTSKGDIQDSRMTDLTFKGPLRVGAVYCATQDVSIVSGVLTINVETNTRNIYVFTHTEDITSIVFNIAPGLDNEAWRIKLLKKPGTSTQTDIPLPAGIAAPENKKAIYVGTGMSFSDFVSYGDNVIEYIGTSRSAA